MKTAKQHHRRFSELTDQEALGCPLSMEQRDELEQAVDADPRCRDENLLYRELAELVDTPADAPSMPGLIDRVLSDDGSRKPQPRSRRSSRFSRRAWAAAAFTVTVAAMALLWSSMPAPRVHVPVPALVFHTPAIVVGSELVWVAGTVEVDGVAAPEGRMALHVGTQVAVRVGRACIAVDTGVRVCLDDGASLRVAELQLARRRIEVMSGRVVATLDPQPEGTSFVLSADGVEVTAVGTVFAVERSGARAVMASVLEGVVEVAAPRGRTQLHAHQRASIASDGRVSVSALPAADEAALQHVVEPSVPVPVPVPDSEVDTTPALDSRPADALSPKPPVKVASAASLIAQAQRLRSQGKRRRAARVYQTLIETYPKRSESRVALISLGDLQLRLGSARAALRSYDRYLARRPGGALVEEAQLGRIRALRALKRRRQERAAIEAFLRDNPRSWEAARLRQRLTSLKTAGSGGGNDE